MSARPIAPARPLPAGAASPLAADLFAATGRGGWRAALAAAVFEPGFATMMLHRWAVGLQRRGLRRSAKLLWRANVAMSSCHLHLDSIIGPGLKLPHPAGVVIGAGARIGERVTIYQHVTVGRARREASFPVIGDDVVIFPNAVVVGGISVGARAVIGAGAVVIADVPEGAVVAGNPARVVACASST
jgi:serine O-acetyltransferase